MTDLNWRIGINSVTLKQASLEEKLKAAGECGYRGFGFWVKDIQQQKEAGRTPAQILELLESWELEAYELVAVRKWQEAPMESFDEAEREARSVFELASEIGIHLVTSPAGPTPHSLEEWRLRLGRLSDIAEVYDITIALEFIRGRSIADFASALGMVRSVERENIGVLLDIFHFYRSGCSPEELDSVRPHEIAVVHLDDAMSKPVDALRDQDRVFPGDGVAPTAAIVSALANIGYEGYFSVKIFNEEYWKMNPREVARIAMQRTRSILSL
jgi:2-keto-myo-inositol isomerase